MKKITSLLIGLLNLRYNPIVIDERGGHWVYNATGTAILVYNYVCGEYAGYYIRFSQSVDKGLLINLESSLDMHRPNLISIWCFNPDIIINFEKVDLIIK